MKSNITNLPPPTSSVRVFVYGFFIAILILFAGMRFYRLTERPMHNDEGVNAWFMMKLIRNVPSDRYRYDPENYHGPSLYYIQLIPTWINGLIKEGPGKFSFRSLAGLDDRSVRSMVVVASLLVLVGVYFCSHRVGPWGAWAAFLLLGLSGNFLYFSRYFIHEMYFVLFTLGIYWGATKYFDTGQGRFVYLFVTSAALLYSTKETSIVTFFVLAFAVVCTEICHRFLNAESKTPLSIALRRNFEWLSDALLDRHSWSLFVAAAIWFLLYSSFFTNWSGLADSIRTYFKWTREGMESGHVKPFFYWIRTVLIPYEMAPLSLSVVGMAMALYKNDKKGLYLTFWTLGILGAYSFIPYKTVWCVIGILLPMALLSGYGIQSLVDFIRTSQSPARRFNLLALALGFSWLLYYQLPPNLRLVYRDYDKEQHEAPYVQTSRDIFRLLNRIDYLSTEARLGKDVVINVLSDVYWPLPYYLREYNHVRYWGKYEGINDLDAAMMIASKSQIRSLKPLLKENYRQEEFTIRSNFGVVLYINESNFKNQLPPIEKVPTSLASQLEMQADRPGLLRRLYIDRRCEGRFLEESMEYGSLQYLWKDEKDKPIYSPFCYEWVGSIKIPKSGTYSFSLESDDGSELYLNDRLVVDNGGLHVQERVSTPISLESGWYKIRLTFFDAGGQGFFKFSWTPPDGHDGLVPPTVLYHTENKYGG